MMRCPKVFCGGKLVEQWRERKQGEKTIGIRMRVCSKCGYEEFPLPTHGYKDGKLVRL
jgi:hypothetical protein